MLWSRTVQVVLVSVMLTGTGGSASAQLGELLRRVPSDANMLVVMDVEKMLATPMAEREFWGARLQLRSSSKQVIISPNVTRVVMATNLDLEQKQSRWTAAVGHLKVEPSLEKVAEGEGGHTDEVDGLGAVWSPRDMFMVKFAPRTFGLMSPANRQAVLRWIRQSKTQAVTALPRFLVGAVDQMSPQTQMLLALDLEGVASPAEVRPDLEALESLKGQAVNRDDLAILIAGVRGLTLAVQIDDQATGVLEVTFEKNASIMAPFAKPLLLEVFAGAGAYLEEMAEWDLAVEGSTVVLSGPLRDSGLRRLGSLMDVPSAPELSTTGQGDSEEAPTPQDTATASQQYFKAVKGYIDDIGRAERAEKLDDAVVWIERYARKIEGLPIVNVDEELLEYSAYVSAMLQDCVVRVKDVSLRSRKRMAAHSNFYDTKDSGGSPQRTAFVGSTSSSNTYGRSYYGNGRYRHRTRDSSVTARSVDVSVERYRRKYQAGERRQIRTEETATGKQEAMAIFSEVKKETQRIRRAMTTRYKIEF